VTGKAAPRSAGYLGDQDLARALATWDDGRLGDLLRARPDLAWPPPPSVAALAARAGSTISASAGRRVLDLFVDQVADALCIAGGEASAAELASRLGEPATRATVEQALERLESLALVVRSGARARAVAGLRRVRPAGLGPPAAEALARVQAPELAAIARRLGVDAGRSKTASLAAVTSALADPSVVAGVVAGGPPGTEELVSALLADGGCRVDSTFGTTDRTPVGWLLARGVAAASSWESIVMPREASLALRGGRWFLSVSPVPPAVAGTATDLEALNCAAAEAALRLVADVVAVAEELAATPGRLLKAGGLGVRDVRRLGKVVDRDEVTTARVVELAAAAGLVAVDGPSDTALPTAAYDAWLALEPPARWAELAAAWLATERHVSLAGAIDHKDKPIPPLLPRGREPDARRRRQAVLDGLAAAGPGRLADRELLRGRVHWAGPSIWSGGPARPLALFDWVLGEAELLGVTSGGALSTQGHLVANGDSALAAAELARRAPATVEDFVIQADLTAVAGGALAPAVRRELELMADVESTGAATVVRFSEATLARALAAGRDAAGLEGFLRRHATKGVPQALSYLIGDVGRRFGRARVGPARSYLRSDDPSLLAELCRARGAARLGLRQVAPTVAVASAAPADLLRVLGASGCLLAEEDAGGGLVLRAAEPRRAAARPAARSLGGPGPVEEVVARLRRSPAPPVAAPARRPATAPLRLLDSEEAVVAAFVGALEELGEDLDWDADECDCDECRNAVARPTAIARGDGVGPLVALACEEEWLVRLAYRNAADAVAEHTVAVSEVHGGRALVERLPRWDRQSFRVDRIEWVRVLTPAEEKVALHG